MIKLRRMKINLLLIGLLLSIPWLVILVIGFYALWHLGPMALLAWLGGSAVLTFVGYQLLWRLQPPQSLSADEAVAPDPNWRQLDQKAWEAVEPIARRREAEDLPLYQTDVLWKVTQEVLQTVAAVYRPDARRAVLEVPLPYVFRIVEIVARDIRDLLAENVPGSHILTIGDLKRLQSYSTTGRRLYSIYRILRMVWSPGFGVPAELSTRLGGRLARHTADQLRRFLIGVTVRKIGYYAIQLYGGRLTLDDTDPVGRISGRSQSALDEAEQIQTRTEEEPLRILLLGQTGAGKSALVNALFGRTRAATDVGVTTPGVTPYVWQPDGQTRAILFDTAGYNAPSGEPSGESHGYEELKRCDLILLVCSAVQPARQPDRELIERLDDYFHHRPQLSKPPLLVAMSHIDRLRPFQEWNPPYDLMRDEGAKAENVRQSLKQAALDLRVEPDRIVPVCLLPERLYNVEEALRPAIFETLPDAEKNRFLRCLREHQNRYYWHQLWRQARRTGRLLWRKLVEE